MSSSTPLDAQIRSTAHLPAEAELQAELNAHLDAGFGDLDVLLGRGVAGPSSTTTPKRGKRRRTLKDEIELWEGREAVASKELEETTVQLPQVLEDTQTRLQTFLSSAQSLSLERYALADKLANLVNELDANAPPLESKDGYTRAGRTVLQQMEGLQQELERLEAGLAWVGVLEQVLLLSERTLSPENHRPSPLAGLSHYRQMNELVGALTETLPQDMALLSVIVGIRTRTWDGLKDIMSSNLLSASEALKWPLRVDYPSVPAAQRWAFECAFQDLLYLQAEGESLHDPPALPPNWASGAGLYPLQAMVQPIALRFKYHFQGSRSTNRVDKPEWAFANILDQLFEHSAFINDYLQPLVHRTGYPGVDVKSEFTLLLFPTLLSLLRSRIPHLLPHPALLAHTIYQTILFDDAVREGGFDFDKVSINEGVEDTAWDGLAGVILKQEGWFEQWLAGEKKFAESQLQDIISSPDAWTITEETEEDDQEARGGMRPTISARQVKALIEQITDRYSPLPSTEYKLPFISSVQLPLLQTYFSRISGSLDAFETLSSAFVRAVPGALSGNARGGIHFDQAKVTGGTEGLGRLVKAGLSAAWIIDAMRGWADDVFFVELSSELQSSTSLRWKIQADRLLPHSLSTAEQPGITPSVFDVLIERYEVLCARTEDMIVRHVTAEVENGLKKHLTRRWDQSPHPEDSTPSSHPHPDIDSSLINALTTLSTLLSFLASTLPPIATLRLYRRIVSHLTNHISQRAVYAGWSKFTHVGGRDLVREIGDFIQTSIDALSSSSSSSSSSASSSIHSIPETIIRAPWEALNEIAKVLALPPSSDVIKSESSQDGEKGSEVTFSQAMAAAWADGESLSRFRERTGVKMGKEELQGVLRRRLDCWR